MEVLAAPEVKHLDDGRLASLIYPFFGLVRLHLRLVGYEVGWVYGVSSRYWKGGEFGGHKRVEVNRDPLFYSLIFKAYTRTPVPVALHIGRYTQC